MDPIAILQNRIEQLEAKLGMANIPIDPVVGQPVPHGDSATANLLNTAQAMQGAVAGLEKLPQAMNMANELNNYTEPNFGETVQQNHMRAEEVAASEAAIRHHCHCMHHCKQSAPVLESEPIQQVPQMQAAVDKLQAAASEVKVDADAVSQGVQELAQTCGSAANEASEQLADVAQRVEKVEEKMFPKRRNGLD